MNSFFFISPRILQLAIWHMTRSLLHFFCAFEARGLENLARLPRGVVFAANHSSEMDAVVVPAALPFSSPFLPVFYVSRPREFYKTSEWRQFFYGGFFFKLWGAHAAVSGSNDYEKSLAAHVEILEKGGSILIFPEGRKTRDGVLQKEAHGGVAYLGRRTGCPIVPVRIFGDFNMTLGDFFSHRRRIVVVFGAPILLTKESTTDYKNDASKVLSALADLE